MRHSTLLTEFTDISQRLEYLLAHSSQLVFVTGEDAAVQLGFVEAFLGQQSQSANVAFITARRGKNNQYYRQQLSEQLDLRTSRSQSFVQAFSARDDKSQPVIIAITSAENVPEEVLRELWDLVLQNRFTRNGEQVNILMFGDHEWAEEVKSWLPTNNNDKPVLLTTQTLEYNEETEVEGDLDDLIANRRKQFQERMQARALGDPAEQSLLSTWWFKLAVASVFLVSFSSILIWQYFDVTESALKEFSQFLFQEEAQSQDSPQGTEELAENSDTSNINQRVAANFSSAMQSIEAVNADSTATEVAETPKVTVNTFSQQSADSANSEYIADISAEQLKQLRDSGSISPELENNSSLERDNSSPEREESSPREIEVISTPATAQSTTSQTPQDQALQASILDALNELDALSVQPEQANTPAERNTSASPISESDSSEAAELTTLEGPQVAVTQSASVDNVNDFQVEDSALSEAEPTSTAADADIPIVAAPATIQPDSRQPASVPEATSQVTTSQTETAQTAASSEPVYQYHEPVLLELPNDSYVLQISGITTESLLEEFLVDNRLLNSVWVYKTQRYGGDWFVVLVNQSFDTLPQARNAVGLLSPDLQAVEPFAKSVAAIRNEILQ